MPRNIKRRRSTIPKMHSVTGLWRNNIPVKNLLFSGTRKKACSGLREADEKTTSSVEGELKWTLAQPAISLNRSWQVQIIFLVSLAF